MYRTPFPTIAIISSKKQKQGKLIDEHKLCELIPYITPEDGLKRPKVREFVKKPLISTTTNNTYTTKWTLLVSDKGSNSNTQHEHTPTFLSFFPSNNYSISDYFSGKTKCKQPFQRRSSKLTN